MPFPKGHRKLGGRKKGTPNRLTKSAKDAYAQVFEELGGADGLKRWALADPENLRNFYNWHTKLIPTEHTGRVDFAHLAEMTDEELEARAKELGMTP